MINLLDLRNVGTVNKPHGIAGEMSVTFDPDMPEPSVGDCLVMEVEGLLTPFFIEHVRPRGNADTWLIQLEGVMDDASAKIFNGKAVYMRKSDLPADEIAGDDDGFFAEDLIGFSAEIDGEVIGKITAVDDRTSNYLFVVQREADKREILIPVADEFITNIDAQARIIDFSLPEGLIEI